MITQFLHLPDATTGEATDHTYTTHGQHNHIHALTFCEYLLCLCDTFGIVVGASSPPTQDDVPIGVAMRVHNACQPLLRHREEGVGVVRGHDGVCSYLHVATGGILEPHRHRQPRGQFAVHLGGHHRGMGGRAVGGSQEAVGG